MYAGGGPEGMVVGGLKVEEPGEALVAAAGKTHSEDVREWSGTGGGGMGNNDFPPKREEGLLGDRDC